MMHGPHVPRLAAPTLHELPVDFAAAEALTTSVSISSTGRDHNRAAYFSSVIFHSARRFSLRHSGPLAPIKASAICPDVGLPI
jgi:hypothetical protein